MLVINICRSSIEASLGFGFKGLGGRTKEIVNHQRKTLS